MKTRRSILSAVMAVILALFVLTGTMQMTAGNVNAEDNSLTTGVTGTFKDIAQGYWAQKYIEKLVSLKIITGVDSEHFAPSKSVTRAEFATMLVKALNLQTQAYSGIFTDVQDGKWYAVFVEAAFKAGLVNGVGNNKFSPEASISREQMSAMVMNAYYKATGTTSVDGVANYSLKFSDAAAISTWAADAVKAACIKGLIKGVTEDTFSPKATAPREQAATIIYMMLDAAGMLNASPSPTPSITPKPTAAPYSPPAISKRQIKVVTTCVKIRKQTTTENMNEWLKTVDKAGAEKPDVIVLSESVYTRGTSTYNAKNGEAVPGKLSNALAAKARQYNCYIVFSLFEKDNKVLYNTAVLIDRNGNIAGKYHKINVPDEELAYGAKPGDSYPVFQTDFGMVGLEICLELQYPEVSKKFVENGAEIIFAPSIGDFGDIYATQAKDNHVFLVVSGQDKLTATSKPSVIIDPDGNVLAATSDQSADTNKYSAGDGSIAAADIDLGPIKK